MEIRAYSPVMLLLILLPYNGVVYYHKCSNDQQEQVNELPKDTLHSPYLPSFAYLIKDTGKACLHTLIKD
jgi:hypothetical protein